MELRIQIGVPADRLLARDPVDCLDAIGDEAFSPRLGKVDTSCSRPGRGRRPRDRVVRFPERGRAQFPLRCRS